MNKRKKSVKRKIFFASPYEIDAIESFLEKEATKGWMFLKCNGIIYTFEECEPIDLKFQVDYFDKATIFDTNPESKTLDYIEYCRESGWNHLFSSGKMQIFYSAHESPVPIETDENRRLKLASKATILTSWISWIFIPLIWGFTIVNTMVGDLLNPKYYLSYSRSVTDLMGMGILIFWFGYTLLGVINMIRFGIFYFGNVSRLKKGLNIKYYSSKNVKRFGTFNQIFLLLLIVLLAVFSTKSVSTLVYFLLGLIGMLFTIFFIIKITYSKWANRKINVVITFIIPFIATFALLTGATYKIMSINYTKISSGDKNYYYSTDDIDITLVDLGFNIPDKILYEETIKDIAGTFLARREEYSDHYYLDDKYYGYSIEIFSSKYSSIMDNYNKLVLENKSYTLKELSDTKNMWGADLVFYGNNKYESRYLVIGEGITIIIHGDLDKIQGAKLSNYYIEKKR